jgi:hypothetical protein
MLTIRPEPAKFLESLRFVQYILVISNIDSERLNAVRKSVAQVLDCVTLKKQGTYKWN